MRDFLCVYTVNHAQLPLPTYYLMSPKSFKKMRFEATSSDTVSRKYLAVSRLMRIWVYFKAAEIELDSAGLQVRQHLK